MRKPHSKSRWLSTMPSIRVLKTKETTKEEDYEWGSRSFVMTLGGPANTNIRKLKDALHEEYDTHCTHSYDCCGRWYTNVWTHTLKRYKSGTWTVRLSYSCNI